MSDDLNQAWRDWHHWHDLARERADEIAHLRAALRKYGDHTYECRIKEGEPCSCGYEAALGDGDEAP